MRLIKNNHRMKFIILVFGFGLVVFALGGFVRPVGASRF